MSFLSTAHPTQVQRKSMLDLTNHIHTLLRKYRDVKLGLINKEKWHTDLRRYIEIIMQTDMIREKEIESNQRNHQRDGVLPKVLSWMLFRVWQLSIKIG